MDKTILPVQYRPPVTEPNPRAPYESERKREAEDLDELRKRAAEEGKGMFVDIIV
jgi:hypothetical protein